MAEVDPLPPAVLQAVEEMRAGAAQRAKENPLVDPDKYRKISPEKLAQAADVLRHDGQPVNNGRSADITTCPMDSDVFAGVKQIIATAHEKGIIPYGSFAYDFPVKLGEPAQDYYKSFMVTTEIQAPLQRWLGGAKPDSPDCPHF